MEAVEEEHDKMVKLKVWKAILRKDIPAAAKNLTSTWAMKKKANGQFRARIVARGYEQIDGQHCNSHNIASPVTNNMTIKIIMILMIMAGWCGKILDVKGAFLHGQFENGEKLYMELPEGFEHHYDLRKGVLFLISTLHGLKNEVMAFWKETLKCFKSMKYSRSKVVPCLYYKWTVFGLVLWVSLIDDFFFTGSPRATEEAKKQMTSRFECDVIGNMDEHIGCKLERDRVNKSITFTQPVMIQSFKDEFETNNTKTYVTPAEP